MLSKCKYLVSLEDNPYTEYYNLKVNLKLNDNLNTAEKYVAYYVYNYHTDAFWFWCKFLLKVDWGTISSKDETIIDTVTYILSELRNNNWR